jgi:hypothetical protein
MRKWFEKFAESKWSSRKFLVAVFALLLIVLNEVLGIGVDPELYWQLVGVASAYILGESIVDAKHKEGKTDNHINM